MKGFSQVEEALSMRAGVPKAEGLERERPGVCPSSVALYASTSSIFLLHHDDGGDNGGALQETP